MGPPFYILVLLIQNIFMYVSTNVPQSVVEPLTVCPTEYNFNPVCGSDGITYMNERVLECTNKANIQQHLAPIYKVKDTECSTCICQKVNLPVCTLEGLTFPNECELACENIKRVHAKQAIHYLAYRAPCVGPLTGCTDVASPVCGTDDILYRNKCVLDTTSSYVVKDGVPPIGVKNNGACLNGCLCPLDVQPVCGSDGCIYNNACYVSCQNKRNSCSKYPFINIVDKSVCEGCTCKPVQNPVCGTDGRTYNNPCELDCEAKRQGNPHLTIANPGKCSSCYCTDEYIPVCGTDQKTYTNECQLRCESAKRRDGYYISVYSYGECQPKGCNCNNCPQEYQPMCGTDGRTYWNLCWLNCNAGCLAKDKTQSQSLFLQRRGACVL